MKPHVSYRTMTLLEHFSPIHCVGFLSFNHCFLTELIMPRNKNSL